MSKVLVENGNLTNIANAIRSKNNTTNVYKPSEMAAAISNLSIGSGDSDTIVFSNDISYLFAGDAGSVLYETIKNKNLVFTNVVSGSYVFAGMLTTDSKIPFDISLQCQKTNNPYWQAFFNGATVYPNVHIQNANYGNFYGFLNSNHFKHFDFNTIDTDAPLRGLASHMFSSSRYLRSINFTNTPEKYLYDTYYNSAFAGCYDLDAVEDLYCKPNSQFSMYNSFSNCSHLAKLTFKKINGSVNGEDVLDLSNVGYYDSGSISDEGLFNSMGFLYRKPKSLVRQDASKEITNAATYARLKNDPNAWTTNIAYSRYNKTSAKETIASLPTTTNTVTIKFNGEAGSATDGGAIKNLTSSEIAVATAKKWTVAFA